MIFVAVVIDNSYPISYSLKCIQIDTSYLIEDILKRSHCFLLVQIALAIYRSHMVIFPFWLTTDWNENWLLGREFNAQIKAPSNQIVSQLPSANMRHVCGRYPNLEGVRLWHQFWKYISWEYWNILSINSDTLNDKLPLDRKRKISFLFHRCMCVSSPYWLESTRTIILKFAALYFIKLSFPHYHKWVENFSLYITHLHYTSRHAANLAQSSDLAIHSCHWSFTVSVVFLATCLPGSGLVTIRHTALSADLGVKI